MSLVWKHVEDFIEKKKEEYKDNELCAKYPGVVSYVANEELAKRTLKQGDIETVSIKLAPHKPKLLSIRYGLGRMDTKKWGEAVTVLANMNYKIDTLKSNLSATFEKSGRYIEFSGPYHGIAGLEDKLLLEVFNEGSAKDVERIAERLGMKTKGLEQTLP